MAYPKIIYNPLAAAPSHVNVLTNVLTVTVANNLSVGDLVQPESIGVATFLNHVVLTVLTVSSTQFTAAFTHADYDAAETAGSIYRVLLFTYPPVNKPGQVDDLEATRTDSIASAGQVESMTQRIDIIKTLNMDFVPNLDLPFWNKFMLVALTGAPFIYYGDRSDESTRQTYTCDDQKWSPRRAFYGISKFALRLRQYVA